MGGMNFHLEIEFDDGVILLARIRRFNGTSPPPALGDYILQSEVASLEFLGRTAVPAPRVFDFALEGANNPWALAICLPKSCRVPHFDGLWRHFSRRKRSWSSLQMF